MNYYEISMVGNIGLYFEILTYQSNLNLKTGQVVRVPAGRKNMLGVVIAKVSKPDFECKDIIEVITDQLPQHVIKLHDWITDYYATKSGTVWQMFINSKIDQKTKTKIVQSSLKPLERMPDATHLKLNNQQEKSVQKISDIESGTIILHGITGSGKTEVYKKIAQQTIDNGQSVIVLVPEISLTTQLVQDFQNQFNQRVVVTHSQMTAAKRRDVWWQIMQSDEPLIIVGPRSALFMPIHHLGLVIVDECHEPAYKQESSPRYHANLLASKLCQITNSKLILGSATPSISDYYMANTFKRPIITMDQLAKKTASKPDTKIIDLTDKNNFCLDSKIFSRQLLTAMRKALSNYQQVLLFHNRRGTATMSMCQNCGWIATCPNCYTPLTLHGDKFLLVCHICGHKEKPNLKCPECQSSDIVYKGLGTKRIEEEAHKLFPKANTKRFDSDSNNSETVNEIYDQIKSGEIDIIIGTQTIAKGLDLPKLSVVGIIQADAGLALPDFSANERTFQLIAQACGRVGRHEQPTQVIVQTYRPQESAVIYGSTQNYSAFYDKELKNRQLGHFPPFAHILKITTSQKTEMSAVRSISELAKELRKNYGDKIKILNPAPAFYERKGNLYRWQIIVRSSKRSILVEIAKSIPITKWQTELDPISLL